jgi:hypothetical protein
MRLQPFAVKRHVQPYSTWKLELRMQWKMDRERNAEVQGLLNMTEGHAFYAVKIIPRLLSMR